MKPLVSFTSQEYSSDRAIFRFTGEVSKALNLTRYPDLAL